MKLGKVSPGDPRTSLHSRGPYEHGSAELAVWTFQSLLALECVWSGHRFQSPDQTQIPNPDPPEYPCEARPRPIPDGDAG